MVLSCTQDAFFARHRHSNYGDLGGAIKVLLEDYQRQAKMNETISSVEDMQVSAAIRLRCNVDVNSFFTYFTITGLHGEISCVSLPVAQCIKTRGIDD